LADIVIKLYLPSFAPNRGPICGVYSLCLWIDFSCRFVNSLIGLEALVDLPVYLLVDFYRRLILSDARSPALLLCSFIVEYGSLEIVWIQNCLFAYFIYYQCDA